MQADENPPWVLDLARMEALEGSGSSRQTIRRRVRRGTWQQPLPGVVCRTTGTLTPDQWRRAALLYAGAAAALSHATAGEYWGYGRPSRSIHVTVPHGRHLRSTAEVIVHQSRRPFVGRFVDDVDITPPARTAIDIGLCLRSQSEVDALLGRSLQSGFVSVSQLSDELDAAPRRGTLFLRLALADVAAGSRAASEARLRRLLLRAKIPLPEFDAAVTTALGVRHIDALWRALRRGVEIDGQAFHFDAASWRADLVRQNAIQTTGIVLLRIAARRLWTEPDAVVAEIRAFLNLHEHAA